MSDLLESNLDTVKVSTLKFGHDKGAPGGGVNARSSGREERIEELGASILAMGLLQPLAVAFNENGVGYVVDGNRRLAALKSLVKFGSLPKDYQVPILVMDQNGDHREASLAANIVRVPLHPVDQFEAFSGLQAAGLDPEEIASRFGVGTRLVKMRIALGDLAPEVRAAWRSGTIGEEAARALTLEKDQRRQWDVLAKLIEDDSRYGRPAQINGWQVRRALGYETQASAEQMDAVGRDAYVAAGGVLIEDLFSDSVVIQNPEIIAQLGEKAIDAKIEELQAQGWAFVHRKPNDSWSYQAFRPEPTAEQRAAYDALEEKIAELDEDSPEAETLSEQLQAMEDAWDELPIPPEKIPELGCFVEFSNKGVVVRQGIISKEASSRPSSAQAPVSGPDGETKAPQAEKGSISKALQISLSEQRTVAASRALSKNANLAVCALVAGLETYGGPVRVSTQDAYPAVRPDRERGSFAKRLRELMEDEKWSNVMDALAAAVAGSLDLRLERGIGIDGCDVLVELLGERFESEARKVFDARDYFERASGSVVKAALEDMGVTKASGKKAELVDLALKNAEANGWLPVELRAPESAKDD